MCKGGKGMKKNLLAIMVAISLGILLLFPAEALAYTAPNLKAEAYMEGGINPYSGGIQNCMAYVWGRAYEKLGIDLTGRIKAWYTERKVYDVPAPNSIALWGIEGNMSHSAFVEDYADGIISYTEGGYRDSANGFYANSMTQKDFEDKQKNHSFSNDTFYGYVYLIDTQTKPTSSIAVTTAEAKDITTEDATLYGKISYMGEKPDEIGVKMGTAADSLVKVAHDERDVITNGNPFNCWFNLAKEAHLELQPDTTYYYQLYAVQSGKEISGEIKSFHTQKSEEELQEIVEYRFRTRSKETEYITSDQPELDGWNRVKETVQSDSWGEWSEWKAEPIEETEEREVESRKVQSEGQEYIYLGRYYSEVYELFSTYKKDETYHFEGGWIPVDKVTFIGQVFKGGRTDGYHVEGVDRYYFFEIGEYGGQRRTSEEEIVEYRSRERKGDAMVYEYERDIYSEWSEWSDWSSDVVEESDTTEVQTRITEQ